MQTTAPCLKEEYISEGRAQMAEAVVDYALGIYINGIVGAPIRAICSFLPDLPVPRLFPQSQLDWPERHELLAKVLFNASRNFGGLVNKALQYSALSSPRQEYRQIFSMAQEDCAFKSSPEEVQAALQTLQSPQKLTQFVGVPVKAASVAQVHLAQWDGQDAVVKIVHSKVRQTYKADLDIMVMLAAKVNSSNEARGIHPMLSSTTFDCHFGQRPAFHSCNE